MRAQGAAPYRPTAQLFDELDELAVRAQHIRDELRRRFGHAPDTQPQHEPSAGDGGTPADS